MNASHIRLLVVDAERRHEDFVAQLRGLDYAVHTTAVPHEAYTQALTYAADVILIDSKMALQQIDLLLPLFSHGQQPRIPILLLGTVDDLEAISRCLSYDSCDYLLLPTAPALIKTRIQTSLEKKQFREQAAWYLQEFNEMEKLADDLRLKILPLGISLSVEKDFDRLLAHIVEEAMDICNADAGTLYLRTEDDHLRFEIVRTCSLSLAYGGPGHPAVPYPSLPLFHEDGAPNRQNVAAYVAHERYSVNVADVYHEQGFDFSGTKAFDRRNDYHTVSCLTVPLKNHRVIGVLQLINAQNEKHQVIPFEAYHQLVAEALASMATVILHNHILTQRHEELLGFRRELEIARQLQNDFLPKQLPQPAGWELAAQLQAAQAVSGDFYDAFMLDKDRMAIMIADVCDKGVGAALFMALLRSLLRAFLRQYYYLRSWSGAGASATYGPTLPPIPEVALQETITLTNEYLDQNHRHNNMFATLFLGVLNTKSGDFTYLNAGHNPPLLLSPDGIKAQLKPTGPAVGLRKNAAYRTAQMEVKRGNMLFAYSDGVTEARSPDNEQFTQQRLMNVVAAYEGTAGDLVAQVKTAVYQHIGGVGQFDDITLLALRHL